MGSKYIYRFYNSGIRTYRRTRKWVYNITKTISRKVQNVSHSVVKHTRNFVNNHRRAIEITRNIVTIASIALIAIPLVAHVAIPAMAIAALGIVEFGLDLAVGDNTSAAADLLCLFPMGKGFKYVTEIGGDAIKGGSKAKNLYKAEGLLEMNLQLFGKGSNRASSIVLRKNMIKSGVEAPDYANAAHHIVAGTDKRAVELRNILKKYDININSAENGVFLPTVKDVSDSAYHRSLHTNEYYKNVEKLFENVGSKEDAVEVLQDIREQLIKGTFPH
ncbi:AHH domain-containing protein [Clostridium sporogenes]|uniref:AHH domain-containing protein n=1 Tax=Clostridium sporogenes TaxID=1509 RepID=UPI0022377F5C|nr:AHH domain-containing protein [Clostridium sporogenes]EKS4344306.1 AHH domain-containing protein [Clostridium botulinum]EKS4394184.1 AHH domain-containing protein [Clostridium botulinum]MCW6080231.1 AHH domain-containing protein [Clostridium sporogenes]